MREQSNPSPWLDELQRYREPVVLNGTIGSDIVIVGAGISGVATAMSLLHKTELSVVLVEAAELGNGATGYNAGQALAEYELPFPQIVRRHGYVKALSAMHDVNYGYHRLGLLLHKLQDDVWFADTHSYEGLSEESQLVACLEEIAMERRAGLINHSVVVANTVDDAKLYSNYNGLYRVVSKQWIQERLRTGEDYIAAAVTPATLINPVLLSAHLLTSLERNYSRRFRFFEHTSVQQVEVNRRKACRVSTCNGEIYTQKVVFCTNGYQTFSVHDVHHNEFQEHMQRQIVGVVGYMATAVDASSQPWAAAYLQKGDIYHESGDLPYIYVTGRPIMRSDGEKQAIHIGGPITTLSKGAIYDPTREFVPSDAVEIMRDFATRRLRRVSDQAVDFGMVRHGLMAYRDSAMMREVGRYYTGSPIFVNRACCGIGLTTAFTAAERIAEMVQGRQFYPSVFDPVQL